MASEDADPGQLCRVQVNDSTTWGGGGGEDEGTGAGAMGRGTIRDVLGMGMGWIDGWKGAWE